MFGKRVVKTHVRVAACGAVDELNVFLGVVRAHDISEELAACIDEIQQRLVGLMGVIATDAVDHERYREKGYRGVEQEDLQWLDGLVKELEEVKGHRFRGWARPGAAGAKAGAFLDVARVVCRRSELATWAIEDDGLHLVRQFLNRLSDVLWLLARERENG